jgi:hypothetical protein
MRLGGEGVFEHEDPRMVWGFFIGYIPACCVGLLVVLGVFYSDWILAAIAENLAGVPSSDVAILYWLYFVAKRLPLFFLMQVYIGWYIPSRLTILSSTAQTGSFESLL